MALVRNGRKAARGWLIWIVLFVLAALTVWWLAATSDMSGEEGGEVAIASAPTALSASRVVTAG